MREGYVNLTSKLVPYFRVHEIARMISMIRILNLIWTRTLKPTAIVTTFHEGSRTSLSILHQGLDATNQPLLATDPCVDFQRSICTADRWPISLGVFA